MISHPTGDGGGTDSGPDSDVGDLLLCQEIGAAKSHGESDSDCFRFFVMETAVKGGEGGVQVFEDGFMCGNGKWELGQVVQITGSRC